jgi:hypothetical protein
VTRSGHGRGDFLIALTNLDPGQGMTGSVGWRRIWRYSGQVIGLRKIQILLGELMKTAIRLMAVATGLLVTQIAVAQAPPAGSTGQCKDGTYSTAASKQGACRGHQGVKEWYAAAPASAAAPAAAATAPKTAAAPASAPTPAPAAAPAPAAKSSSSSSKTAAPGGGPGLVWLNTSSNVYHCYGGEDYGTTKAGAYMSEADAKAKGAHADHGKPCSK